MYDVQYIYARWWKYENTDFTRCFARLWHQGKNTKTCYNLKLCSFLSTEPNGFLCMVKMLLPTLKEWLYILKQDLEHQVIHSSNYPFFLHGYKITPQRGNTKITHLKLDKLNVWLAYDKECYDFILWTILRIFVKTKFAAKGVIQKCKCFCSTRTTSLPLSLLPSLFVDSFCRLFLFLLANQHTFSLSLSTYLLYKDLTHI